MRRAWVVMWSTGEPLGFGRVEGLASRAWSLVRMKEEQYPLGPSWGLRILSQKSWDYYREGQWKQASTTAPERVQVKQGDLHDGGLGDEPVPCPRPELG